MQQLRISAPAIQRKNGKVLAQAEFQVAGRKKSVWFRTDEGPINNNAAPLLPVALAPAMRRGWNIELDAPLPEQLLRNSEEIQATFADWYKEFSRIDVVAQTAQTIEQGGKGGALFFSGGVDSFHSLYKNRDKISHLIFVHGFDLPLRWREMRRLAADRARHVANSLGIELIEVETNLREFGQAHVSWPKAYYGSGLAAVSLLLAPRFERIYLSSGYTSAEHPPSGSHPDMDPLWTDGSTEILYEGQDENRFEKLDLLHRWPLAQENLRVCYQNTAPQLNCGRCVKCVWTQMILRALGCEESFNTFQQPLSLKRLKRFPPSDRYVAQRFQRCLEISRDSGKDLEFIRTLEEGLNKQGDPPLLARATQFRYRVGNYLAHRMPGGTP